MNRIPWPWLAILLSLLTVVGWLVLGWLALWIQSLG